MYNTQDKIDRETLLKDEQFLQDATDFLIDREGYEADDLMSAEDVYNNYMEHFRFQNVNEVTAINDMLYAQNADDEQKEKMARLMETYDKMDSDLGLRAGGDYIAGVLSAPSTYAGIFTGGGAKVGALAAQQGIKLGIRDILKRGASKELLQKAVTEGGLSAVERQQVAATLARQAATKGAVRAGAVEGTIGAGQVAAQEQARVELGMQDEIRGGAVALGAAAGTIPGAAFGAGQQVQRAVVSNVAERVTGLTEKQTARATNNANRTTTRETFESKETGELANTIFENLKEKKLALKETIGEELEAGMKLKQELKPDDVEIVDVVKADKPKLPLEASVEMKNLQNIAAVAAKIVKDVPDIPDLPQGTTEAFTSKLVRALRSGDLNTDKLVALTQRHGIRFEDIGSLLAAEVSSGASLMGKISGLSKASKKELTELLDDIDIKLIEAGQITNPAREAVEELDDQLGRSTLEKSNDFLKNVNKARIGMMTIQLATTARNMTNGYMRNYVYAFDNLGAGLYNKHFSNKAAKNRLALQGKINPTDEELREEAIRAVNLGNAQMRTAYDAFLFKDLMTITSAQTTALARLMKNPAFGKSQQAQQLFMEMGDVADHTKQGGMLLNTARLLNKLNTKSDNMFKRAVLSHELNKTLRASGFEDGLDGVLRKGRFGDIDEKIIASAMEKALDFTYQTGRFKGKEGLFNTAADTFIQAAQTPLGSTFVPFPRYLVNQFRFVYEHAPVFGLFDIGGILNKSDAADRFGKQMGGLAMLGTMYAMRSNHGDETTGPFEYKNPFGTGLVDAQASLGPFSAYAFMADFLYQMNNPNMEAKFDGREFTKALGGGQFRPTGLAIVDNFFDTIDRGMEDGKTDLQIKEMLTKYVGNVANTFTVGAGVLKDVVATLDPEFRAVPDNTDVNYFQYFLKQATRSFPQSVDENGSFYGYSGLGPKRTRLESPTKSTGLRVMNPFMRQLTGLTQREERNMAEREFDRLGLNWAQITPRKIPFDAELTNEARGQMGRFVESAIQDYVINDPEYAGLGTNVEKKAFLLAKLEEMRAEARARIMDTDRYVDIEDQRRIARAKFFDLSKEKRDLIAVYYDRETGKNLGDTMDYLTALGVAEEYNISGGR
jgi:hypothetical protein